MIAIIDYGMGNLRSVQKGLESVGARAVITTDKKDILEAKGVVLPGVGAFADAIGSLKEHGLIPVIAEIIQAQKPFLGICLGLQLLFEYSEENGLHQGLGILGGGVKRLPAGLKIPHMGWNELHLVQQGSPIISGIPEATACYFVHSYHVIPEDRELVIATVDYGGEVVAIVGRGLVFGIQFHPEKSSKWGLQILSNFGKLVRQC